MSLMFLSVVYDTALNLKTHETYILFEVRKFVHSRIRAVWPTCSSSHTAWDTSKHLHDLTSHVTHEANTRIDSTISGKLAYRIHVHLECEPYTALNAPLTEVVVWKMREGASRAVVEQLLTKLMSIVTKIPMEEGKYKNGWGRIINEDKEKQFIVLIGWTDMEVSWSRPYLGE